eukprot:tig00020629_g12472.t1
MDMKSCCLTEWPAAEIASEGQICIRVLDLAVNRLSVLPPEIGKLKNLTVLDLSCNWLTSLPPEIGQLENLKDLNISCNELTALPPEIGQLANLEMLNADRNELTTLPPELGHLENLETLHVDANRLTALPPEIGQLFNLRELSIRDNQLMEMPKMCNMFSLRSMLVEGNPMVDAWPQPARRVVYDNKISRSDNKQEWKRKGEAQRRAYLYVSHLSHVLGNVNVAGPSVSNSADVTGPSSILGGVQLSVSPIVTKQLQLQAEANLEVVRLKQSLQAAVKRAVDAQRQRESARNRADELQRHLEELNADVQRQLEVAQKRATNLQRQLEASQKQVADATNLQRQLEASQKQVADSFLQLEDMQRQLEASRKRASDVQQQSQKRAADAQRQVETSHKRAADLQQQLERSQHRETDLKEQLERLQAQLQWTSSEARAEDSQRQIDQLRAELAASEQRAADVRRRNGELLAQLAASEQRAADAQRQLEEHSLDEGRLRTLSGEELRLLAGRLRAALLLAELEIPRTTFECGICLARRPRESRRVLQPCGHVFCATCAPPLLAGHGLCPACRCALTGSSPIFD